MLNVATIMACGGNGFRNTIRGTIPVAIEAMLRLDLGDHIEPWLELYLPLLDDAPEPRGLLTEQTWLDHLGDVRSAGDWQLLFGRELAERDWQSVVRTWWPRLLPGLAASAAHGVIRTCHAVRTLQLSDSRDPDPLFVDELARGLGLWASRSPQPMAEIGDRRAPMNGNKRPPVVRPTVPTVVSGRQVAAGLLLIPVHLRSLNAHLTPRTHSLRRTLSRPGVERCAQPVHLAGW